MEGGGGGGVVCVTFINTLYTKSRGNKQIDSINQAF